MTVAKIRASGVCVYAPCREVPVSYSKAKGEHKGGVSLAMVPQSAFIASTYVTNLKPVPQAEAPGPVGGPLSPAD